MKVCIKWGILENHELLQKQLYHLAFKSAYLSSQLFRQFHALLND